LRTRTSRIAGTSCNTALSLVVDEVSHCYDILHNYFIVALAGLLTALIILFFAFVNSASLHFEPAIPPIAVSMAVNALPYFV
jgi:hypothetical protein